MRARLAALAGCAVLALLGRSVSADDVPSLDDVLQGPSRDPDVERALHGWETEDADGGAPQFYETEAEARDEATRNVEIAKVNERLREGDERFAWQNLDPRREGAGVLSLVSEVGIIDPTTANAHHRTVGGGLSLQMVGRRKGWPLMVGLSGGVMLFGGASGGGPVYGGSTPNGSFYLGTTREERGVELRHAELRTRLQPFWWRVRPYAEGEFGLMVLWSTAKLTGNEGQTLYSRDRQHSASYVAGVTLGLDITLTSVYRDDPTNTWDIVLSAGVRRLFTGRMESPDYVPVDGSADLRHVDERLRIWQPFLSIGVSGKSKPRPKKYPYGPTYERISPEAEED